MFAKERAGSFSPAGPVSTLRVIRRRREPPGQALENKFDARRRRQKDMVCPKNSVTHHSVLIDRNAVE